jgi:hypothetical protein
MQLISINFPDFLRQKIGKKKTQSTIGDKAGTKNTWHKYLGKSKYIPYGLSGFANPHYYFNTSGQ